MLDCERTLCECSIANERYVNAHCFWAQACSGSASMKDRQQAVKLRVGAHLGLALGYLPVPVPTPQDALTIRTQEDIEADPDADVNSSDDLPLQV